MNKTLNFILLGLLLSAVTASVQAQLDHSDATTSDNHLEKSDAHADHQQADDHDDNNESDKNDESHGQDDHDEGVHISSQQADLANITVAVLTPRIMDYQLYAPGEIKTNGYTSYLASPRVDSVVLRRHAALGDHVQKGQPLVTLFSESVAEAQAAYKVAYGEWQRVQKLGRATVGGKRYISAQTGYETAYARLSAFGLSQNAIKSLIKKSPVLGEYTLLAVNAGAVLSDDFHQGQRVEAGQALMELADERELWVEARLPPTVQLDLPTGTEVQIKVANNLFTAKVTQEAHTIDPKTRTRVVRMQVNNDAHLLHPGLFADVYFSISSTTPVLAVPESALMRSADGDWTVFVEQQPEQYMAQEVDLGRQFGKSREISGIKAGSRVVMTGAFFVASEIAKGDFDPHNH